MAKHSEPKRDIPQMQQVTLGVGDYHLNVLIQEDGELLIQVECLGWKGSEMERMPVMVSEPKWSTDGGLVDLRVQGAHCQKCVDYATEKPAPAKKAVKS